MDNYFVVRLLSTVIISFTVISSAVQAQNDSLSGFSVLPSNITTRLSFPARFDCQGSPSAGGFIRWAVGSNFELPSDLNCNGCQQLKNGSLYIPVVTQAHSGVYTCLIIGGSFNQPRFSVYLTIATDTSTMIPVMSTTMASDTSTTTVTMSTTATPSDVAMSNNSGSSSDNGAIIGGAVGGVILLLMTIIVLCIVILCVRRHHRRESSQEYDKVFYDKTKLNTEVTIKCNPSYEATEDETTDYLPYSTINEDSDVPITTYSSDAVPPISCSKTISEEYDDTVQAKGFVQYSDVEDNIKMDTSPSHGVSIGEDRRVTATHIHDNSTHCMATITADVEEQNVQIKCTLDQRHRTKTTHSPLTANSTMLTDEGKYGVNNQLRCDDFSFDTTVDQSSTTKSFPLPYLPFTANDARPTDGDEYGVVDQPQCDDLI